LGRAIKRPVLSLSVRAYRRRARIQALACRR